MEAEELKEEISHTNELIRQNTRVLHLLERQAAASGLYVPPHIQLQIEDTKQKIDDLRHTIEAHIQEFKKVRKLEFYRSSIFSIEEQLKEHQRAWDDFKNHPEKYGGSSTNPDGSVSGWLSSPPQWHTLTLVHEDEIISVTPTNAEHILTMLRERIKAIETEIENLGQQ